MMCRQDYIQVAETWGKSLAACTSVHQVTAMWSAVVDQADMFAAVNPQFDRARFMRQVRVSEETHNAYKGLVS